MPFPDFNPTTPAFLRHLQEHFADRELIVYEGRRLTYGEAIAASARLARGMLASGIGKGTRVGLLMPNSPDFVLAWLAAARIGAIVIPINTFYKPRELGWAAAFLASPWAAYVSGHTFVVDGANWQRRAMLQPEFIPIREQLGKGPFRA